MVHPLRAGATVLLLALGLVAGQGNQLKCGQTQLQDTRTNYERCASNKIREITAWLQMKEESILLSSVCTAVHELLHLCGDELGWCFTQEQVEVTKSTQQAGIEEILRRHLPVDTVETCLHQDIPIKVLAGKGQNSTSEAESATPSSQAPSTSTTTTTTTTTSTTTSTTESLDPRKPASPRRSDSSRSFFPTAEGGELKFAAGSHEFNLEQDDAGPRQTKSSATTFTTLPVIIWLTSSLLVISIWL